MKKIEVPEGVEPGLGEKVKRMFPDLPPLLDYETELAIVPQATSHGQHEIIDAMLVCFP